MTAHVSISVSGITAIARLISGVGDYDNDTVAATGTSTAAASGNSTPLPPGSAYFTGYCGFLGGTTTLTDGAGWNPIADGFDAGMLTRSKQTDNSALEALYTEYIKASSVKSAIWTVSVSDTWFASVESYVELIGASYMTRDGVIRRRTG